MKLLRCRVENFGKLCNFEYQFHDGINEVLEENGWGKSTLAAFIKVMLYGFSNETKRDAYENERKRYAPWQKGVYGGELDIEIDNIPYRIRRVFGVKQAEDDFSLVDLRTYTPTNLYTDKIGEELFEIDSASFERTIFFSSRLRDSNHQETTTKATSSINAKIGNVTDCFDDMNHFDEAVKRCKTELDHMTPKRKTGLLHQKNQAIQELTRELKTRITVEASMQEYGKLEEELLQKKQQEKMQYEILLKEQNEISKYKDLHAIKQTLLQVVEEEAVRRDEMEACRRAFQGELPTPDNLVWLKSRARQYDDSSKNMNHYALTESERELLEKYRRLYPVPPKEADIEEIETATEQLYQCMVELQREKLSVTEEERLERWELLHGAKMSSADREYTLGMLPAVNEQIRKSIALRDERKDLQITIRNMKAFQSAQPGDRSGSNVRRPVLIPGIVGMLTSLLAIVVLVYTGNVVAACFFGVLFVGCLLFVAIGAMRGRKKNVEEDTGDLPPWYEAEQELEAVEEEYWEQMERIRLFFEEENLYFQEESYDQDFREYQRELRDIYSLYERRERMSESMALKNAASLENKIRSYLSSYEGGYIPMEASWQELINGAVTILAKMKREGGMLKELAGKEENYRLAEQERKQARNNLMSLLGTMGISLEEQGLDLQIQEIERAYQEYIQAQREWTRAKTQLEEWQSRPDYQNLLELEEKAGQVSMEELQDRLMQCAERMKEYDESVRFYQTQLRLLQDQLDDCRQKEEELKQLQEEFRYLQQQYLILGQTKEFLEQAKNRFTNTYTEPVMKGFRKFYGYIHPEEANLFHMDMDGNLSVTQCNLDREVQTQSTGQRDFIGICMRMAYVEAMYQKEKPFLIMDDPFINLDEEGNEKSKEYLSHLSEEYQMLYFTCHSSRSFHK